MAKISQINEDGHTDVASARRKAVLIIEDASQMLAKLKQMDPSEGLPSWWMNKMAVTAAYMDSMRNFLLVPSSDQQGSMPEMSTEENIEEISTKKLGQYIGAASKDDDDADDVRPKSVSGLYTKYKRTGSQGLIDKMVKRQQGIQKASEKLSRKMKRSLQGEEVKKISVKEDLEYDDPKKHKKAKEHHYKLGKQRALAGKEKGETSDNYGPYAADFEKGYHDHHPTSKFKKIKEDSNSQKSINNTDLKGNQHKLDANKNGKVDAHDFHLLRKIKKARYK